MRQGQNIVNTLYESFPGSKIRTRAEVLREISLPCGRFNTPISTEESLAAFITERLLTVDPLHEGQLFAGSGFPLNWQRLITYLYNEHVIDQKTLGARRQAHDRPKLKNFGVTMSNGFRKTDGRTSSYNAFAASFNTEEAISKMLGEALERYFLSLYQKKSLQLASPAALKAAGQSALDLGHLNAYLPWQKEKFSELNWDDTTPFRWVPGEVYTTRKPLLLPAQLVFWNYLHRGPEGDREKMIARTTSSGCAGHFTKDEAVLSGLKENIERDAFLVYWLNHLSPPVIDQATLHNEKVRELIAYCARYQLELVFLNTTGDIPVPSITCVVIDRSSEESPIISIGAASGFNIADNCIHSAIEGLLVNNYTSLMPTFVLPNDYQAFADTSIDRAKRLSLWKGPEMAKRIAFFTAGAKQDVRALEELCTGKDTPANQLAFILDELKKRGPGYEVYVYEARDKVLDAIGFHVVRTIVPKLMPLYLWEHTALLDSIRLHEVPGILGMKSAEKLNPWPHPFP